MGTFRVEIQAVGSHGCQREKKNDETVEGCRNPGCVDCITREYLTKLRGAGAFFNTTGTENSIGYAKLTHWPGTAGSVIDNLLTSKRVGSFGG